jgi:signal transduction histidine kinase
MSYRAFKRLLGETSLERKCRFLLGGFILVLITGSFWLYARQTEHLAYEQIVTTCRLLMIQIVDEKLATKCRIGDWRPDRDRTRAGPDDQKIAAALDEFSAKWQEHWPEYLKKYYKVYTFRPNAVRKINEPNDGLSIERLKEFQANRGLEEDNYLFLDQPRKLNYYFGAVRATKTCIACHEHADLAENDLIALVKIEVPTTAIKESVELNRAVLISTALVTALLIMAASYLIIRYVIVKPVKHLKEVSDAISAGELNVRSEIQTGDEFEDLSYAFNRMLRNLVSMQERHRKVNADLDRKVDELAQANLALYESNQLKGGFLATVSHELKTPLNSILGFSEVLQSSTGLNDKQLRWVNNIRSSGEQLLNLISDILDLAKIEAGKMQVRVTEFSAFDVCEGLLTMFRPLAEKKNIDLKGTLSPDVPLLRQDVVKFRQILSNLLSNAIKFTPEGGRVQLKTEASGGYALLTVSDTGVGIAPEEQEQVFEKFRQSGTPLTREHAGSGLGLSIVRELSKLLGGDVSLQSELGRGSTFTVRLPLQLSVESRLEFDLSHHGIDLTKAQRIEAQLYGPETRVETP